MTNRGFTAALCEGLGALGLVAGMLLILAPWATGHGDWTWGAAALFPGLFLYGLGWILTRDTAAITPQLTSQGERHD